MIGAGMAHNEFLQVTKDTPMMNMQAQNTEQLLNRISVLEKRLKQLSGQKTKAESNINPVSFSAEPNRVDTFHRGADNALWHNWSINGRWSAWESLGGVLKSDPAVISQRPNLLEVFVRGDDDAMWHKQWDHGRWSDWVSKGGILRSDPAVVSW